MDNTTIRVTKAQKLDAIKRFISDDARHVFPGNDNKAAYVFDKNAMIAFIDEQIELLAKKNSGDRKQTADQKKNEEYKEKILDYLAGLPETDDKGNKIHGATCSEIFKGIPDLAPFSPQKVSALMRQLKAATLVDGTEVKGKMYFHLI